MFPDELMDQYRLAMARFKKTQKTMFRRFGPNLSELSDELGQVLGPKFHNSDLPEYAALCWLAAAKCEQDVENRVTAIDYFLKAGNAFVRADDRAQELFPGSNTHEHLTGAVRCFKDALSLVGEESAMGAGIIRQLKRISPGTERSSQFHSPCHRIRDLETSARREIQAHRFLVALEQLTEICEIVQEERSEQDYEDTMAQVEVLLLLLLLILRLPPGRQSPIHLKILNKFSPTNDAVLCGRQTCGMTISYILALQNLNSACQSKDGVQLVEAKGELLSVEHSSYRTTLDHRILLDELTKDCPFV